MLNKQQEESIKYNKGPLLIIAGPGTGKTTVIVKKIEYIIINNLAKPEEILALTFTEKSASEMEERLDQMLPYGYFQMTIDTFHGFSDQILRSEIINLGKSNNYKLLNKAETIIFFKNNLFAFNLDIYKPLGNPVKFIENIIDHFSRLKDENISPEEYLLWTENHKFKDKEEAKKYKELANAYKIFQDLKEKENFLDFSDLIYYLIRLFKKKSSILKYYQKKFKYVLIDEFQDTNIAQYQLIKLLKPPKANPLLTVVGDDSQAIYKFRGASLSNILNFMKDYPNSKQINLVKNYRSNQEILNKSYQLIQNNNPDTLETKLGISKKLISSNKKKLKKTVSFYLGEDVDEETNFVIEKILELKKKFNYKYRDFAILTRANDHAEPFIKNLSYKGIPYQFLGPDMLFKQPEVKDLIAYLKFLNNIDDNLSLYRVLLMKIFNFNIIDLQLIINFSNKTNISLFQGIEIYLSFFYKKYKKEKFDKYYKFIPLLKKETREKLRFFFEIIRKHFFLLKKYTPGEILYDFIDKTGYLRKLSNYKTEKEEKIVLNISNFFKKLKAFENENKNEMNLLKNTVDLIDLTIETGESPIVQINSLSNQNAVNLLTVHSAKGLEFPVVFLVNLTQGRFPSREKKEIIPIPDQLIKEILPEKDPHTEEERRLFYVGMTRAKDFLYLSASKFYGQEKRQQKISKFVVEIFGKNLISKNSNKKEKKIKNSIFSFKKNNEKKITENNEENYFSYTHFEIYEKCPLQYKYYFLLKLPVKKTASINFGNVIHQTMLEFYKLFQKNNDISERELINIYKKNWNPLGFLSRKHEEDYFRKGKSILKRYLKKYHNKNLNIIGLEMNFKLKILDNFFIIGKIDRIDQLKNKKIEIIDYKTGNKPDNKKIIKDPQLSIYALALSEIYKKPYEDIVVSYIYLDNQEKITLVKEKEEIEMIKKQIIEKIKKIKTKNFSPKPGFHCKLCPFKTICDAWN